MEQREIRLRLSIWRPASLNRTYLHNDDESRPEQYSLLHESALLEQIYTWDTGRHDLFGSCDGAAAELIRDRLVGPFSQHRAPATRSVCHFRSVVTELIGDPGVHAGAFWSDSPDTVTTSSGELNLRANVALSVLRHFRWVAGVYADVPGASVLLR